MQKYPIPGWQGYEASHDGQIWSPQGRQLRITKNHRVILYDADGKPCSLSHALVVALAFCGPKPEDHNAAVDKGRLPAADTVRWVPDPVVAVRRELGAWDPPRPTQDQTDGVLVHTCADYAARVSCRQLRDYRLSPYPLTFLGAIPGGDRHERVLHDRFEAHRIRGKWYRLEGLRTWLGDDQPVAAAPVWSGEPVTDTDIAPKYAETHSAYILQLGDTGPFRVGYAKNVSFMLRMTQIANFDEVILRRLIDAGPMFAEHLRAKWSGADAIHSDWYHASPGMAYAVRKLRNAYAY